MTAYSSPPPRHEIHPRLHRMPAASTLEWRVVDIPRDVSRSQARSLLTEQAEYGRWELARSQKFISGARRVWLKRRVLRVERTDSV